MPRLSNADFDLIVTELAKTELGAVAVRDHRPVKDPVTDLPIADDNSFVVSVEQRDDTPHKAAHTRVDIRGADGLIHTSYEADHVRYQSIDTAVVGQVIHGDVEHPRTGERLFGRGHMLGADDIDVLREAGVTKIANRVASAAEIAADLRGCLEADQPIQGTVMRPRELATLSRVHEAARGSRSGRPR